MTARVVRTIRSMWLGFSLACVVAGMAGASAADWLIQREPVVCSVFSAMPLPALASIPTNHPN